MARPHSRTLNMCGHIRLHDVAEADHCYMYEAKDCHGKYEALWLDDEPRNSYVGPNNCDNPLQIYLHRHIYCTFFPLYATKRPKDIKEHHMDATTRLRPSNGAEGWFCTVFGGRGGCGLVLHVPGCLVLCSKKRCTACSLQQRRRKAECPRCSYCWPSRSDIAGTKADWLFSGPSS